MKQPLEQGQPINVEGGIVIVTEGKILSRLSLPIGGIMSVLKVPRLAGELERIIKSLKDLGCSLEDPLWTFGFLSFTSLREFRITFSGVYEVKTGKIIYNGFEGRR